MPKIISCTKGEGHTLILTNDHVLYAFGKGGRGQLGDGSNHDRSLPIKVRAIPDKVISATTGDYFSLALTDKGQSYGWGDNSRFQLRKDKFPPLMTGRQPLENYLPSRIYDKTKNIIAISSEGARTLARTEKGQVFSWGNSHDDDIGPRASLNRIFNHGHIKISDNIVSITSGFSHSLALTSKGEVLGWGWNRSGQLGYGNSRYVETPHKVKNIADGAMVIRAGNSFSMALTKTQEVYYWGSGYPEKGNGTFYSESRRPKKVEGIGGEVIKIAAGHTFSLALTKEGKVYGWGNILSTLEGHKYGWEETPVLIKGLNLEFVPAIFGSGGHIPNLSDLTKLHRLILGKGIAL